MATRRTGLCAVRSSCASSSSPGVIPARASVRKRTRSASSTAALACSTIERAIGSLPAMSMPPVSINRNRLPFHSQTSSLRSRVTPGVSWTTAARVSVRRLTSVDLPTLGKPTIATVPRRPSSEPAPFSALMPVAPPPPAPSRGGNHVFPTSPLLLPSSRRRSRRSSRRVRRRAKAGGPPGSPLPPPPTGSCRLAFADELLDPGDDVLDVELRGVDLHRILRRHHPLGVALVAETEVGRQRVGADLRPLGEPALGPDRPVGVEVDLHVGARAHDGADVAPLDHGIAELGELPLARAHDRSHLGVPRDDRDDPIDPRLADRGGHVGLVDPHTPVLVERDRILVREEPEPLALAERDVPRRREPGQRAVHRAGVEIAVAEPLREPAGDRAFARSRRPVDGNDHRSVTESSSSKNPGKLTATASASSISTPSIEVRPATAPSIAILWSPRV